MSWPPADRCAWSGKRSPRVIQVEVPSVDRFGRGRPPVVVSVLPEHEAELRAHADRLRRYAGRFLAAVVLLGIVSFVAAIAGAVVPEVATVSMVIAGVGVLLIGLLFLALPFSTPETSAFFGLRRSMAIVRILGAIMAAMGVWIVLYGWA